MTNEKNKGDLEAEIESLQHDLSRHLSITSEQATEILGLQDERAHHASQWLSTADAIFRRVCQLHDCLANYLSDPDAWDREIESREFSPFREAIERQATEILGKEKALAEAKRLVREWAPTKALKLEAISRISQLENR